MSLLALAATAAAARSLSPDSFGSFSFAKNLLVFLALVFEFGLASSGARLIATAGNKASDIVGTAALSLFLVGLVFTAALIGVAPVVGDVFHVDVRSALLLAAPFGFAYSFRQQFGLQLARAAGRLHVFSWTNLLGQAGFLCALLVAERLTTRLTTSEAILAQSVAFGASSVVGVAALKPRFRDVRRGLNALVRETRRWGFQLYVGRVLAIGTYNMDVLMLGAFAQARTVGYYVLGGSIASVTVLPVNGAASALFPSMARGARFSYRWVAVVSVYGAAAILGVTLAARPFVTFVFGGRFAPAASLAVPLTVASALMGVTTVYSTYLSARGWGSELRRAGFALAGANVVLNLALIPAFGATGAAWASVAALAINVVVHDALYRRRRD